MKPMMRERAAFIGLGAMGLPIAVRLADGLAGLAVADLVPDRAVEASGLSAVIVDDAAQIQSSELVFLCLPSREATRSVVENLLGGGAISRTIVDLGAFPPDFVAELAHLCASRGVTYCDAPVFGTPSMAASGELYFLFSGPRTAWEGFSDLVAAVGYRSRYAGPTGAASAVKVLQNALGTANLLAGAEALRVCEAAGIGSRLFIDVVRECGGIGQSTVFDRFAEDMAARRDSDEGRLRIAAKDAASAANLADQHGVQAPLLQQASNEFHRAMQAGLSESQFTAIIDVDGPTDAEA